MSTMVKQSLLTLVMGFFVITAAQAQTPPAPGITGKCELPSGETVAPDGSCGTWTAKLKSTETGAGKKPKVSVTTIIDFGYLVEACPGENASSYPMAIFYVCVTKGHDSHTNDRLILAITDKKCSPNAVRRSSISDLADCEKAGESGWLENGTFFWCLGHNKVGCRYLPLRPGQKLSAWITNSKPDLTSPRRSASGTWALVK